MPSGWGQNERLERLTEPVKWYRFENVLRRIRSEGPGRPGYLPLAMFKALLLQSRYGLSDAELEAELLDRLSFNRFVGLSLEDDVPDHTTLCRFRNRLVEDGLLEKLFPELDRQLDKAGVILKRGTMLDATLIEAHAASPSTPGKASADPDAAIAKRSGKPGFTFG